MQAWKMFSGMSLPGFYDGNYFGTAWMYSALLTLRQSVCVLQGRVRNEFILSLKQMGQTLLLIAASCICLYACKPEVRCKEKVPGCGSVLQALFLSSHFNAAVLETSVNKGHCSVAHISRGSCKVSAMSWCHARSLLNTRMLSLWKQLGLQG